MGGRCSPFCLHNAFTPGLLCAVSKWKRFLIYWSPVILWLCVITVASGDQKSVQHSSRIIGPVLHWLFPQLSEQQVWEVVYWVRKCAHMTEFGVLALVCWRAFQRVLPGALQPWSWRNARSAWLCCLLFASVDEVHQLFVPGRQGSVMDVMIDCAGAAIALLLLRALGRKLKWW